MHGSSFHTLPRLGKGPCLQPLGVLHTGRPRSEAISAIVVVVAAAVVVPRLSSS